MGGGRGCQDGTYLLPFERVKERVMPVVLAKAEAEKKVQGKEVTRYTRIAQRWWQFYDYRPGTIAAINSVPRWIACSRTTKRSIFEFVSREIHADSKLMVFPLADDYSFGILQSGVHWQWVVAKGSTLKEIRTTRPTLFSILSLGPQSPTAKQVRAVAAAVELRTLRRAVMARLDYSLRDLYRTLEEPGANPVQAAHAALDAAVRAAYGMGAECRPARFLAGTQPRLRRARDRAGQPIIAPGTSAQFNIERGGTLRARDNRLRDNL